MAHRTTLMYFLDIQTANLEIIDNYNTEGNGNLAMGLVSSLSDTITFMEKSGEELFKSVT